MRLIPFGKGQKNEDWFPGSLELRVKREGRELKAAYLLGYLDWWEGYELEDCPFSVMDQACSHWIAGYQHVIHCQRGDGRDTPSLNDLTGLPADHFAWRRKKGAKVPRKHYRIEFSKGK